MGHADVRLRRLSDPPIRDAATVIVLRDGPGGARVLMGQRGAGAAFMPSKFVFPGGAVEPGDAGVSFARALAPEVRDALARSSAIAPETLAAAALRELAEETGQVAGRPGPPCGWPGFEGRAPDAGGMRFVFRAVTPPGRPRRFDARFFLMPVETLVTDPDDFSRAEDELSHLHWVSLAEARALDLPFVTEVALAEVAAILAGAEQPGVPHFDNSGPGSVFRRL